MTTTEWIIAIVAFLIAIGMAIISVRSFKNKGFLFNNAYIYASKQERETMNKKPYYKQSAVVFWFLSAVFFVIGLSLVLQNDNVSLLEIPLIVGVIIYAIASTVQINKQTKK